MVNTHSLDIKCFQSNKNSRFLLDNYAEKLFFLKQNIFKKLCEFRKLCCSLGKPERDSKEINPSF